ncbi:MAG: glutamate synthase subunit beta [Candidatus Hydrogenedentes bacterium]|nr:glutamate synthase subunit beta [Candidatus Hydrogenedentota bacterium]
MAKPTGFMEYDRVQMPKRPVEQRVHDFHHVEQRLDLDTIEVQAARCMDCGIPYCHSFGCPLGNRIPDFNDMVYHKQWRRALDILHEDNNFPEFTGRVCPALCEAACTLSLDAQPVTIRQIELEIVEQGWEHGWIEPQPALTKSGATVAVVGSGPAGMAAAQQIARAGHEVVLFEKADQIGGILRYGIPDFKLEKRLIDRRMVQMAEEGVSFETGVDVGTDISARYLNSVFDAIVIAVGCRKPRDLDVPGRDMAGIHFAMDFLTQQNMRVAGDTIDPGTEILAEGKRVVVVGGGDTGADCVGTSRRQGATDIVQIELLDRPPDERDAGNPWPTWPLVLRTSSSHEEGCERQWSILTKEFLGDNGTVRALKCVNLEWSEPDATGRRSFTEIEGSEFEIPADLVLLAMGFTNVDCGPMLDGFGAKITKRGTLAVDEDTSMTSAPGVFAAGDCVSGPWLVVRAIEAGRRVADDVNRYLATHEPHRKRGLGFVHRQK